MTRTGRAELALGCVVAALLSDWLAAELFMRRDTVLNIAGAVSLVTLFMLLALGLARALLPERFFTTALHAMVLVGLAVVLLSGARTAMAHGNSMSFALRLAVVVCAVLVAWLLVRRLNDETSARLMRASALACVAFIALPFIWRATGEEPRVWIGPAEPATMSTKRATLFLLFDEMGAAAAHPIAEDLRAAGLRVREDALEPAGENTLNVIPALFSGANFARARACGRSTLCSGAQSLDFSRITVQRTDVDATGLLVPYCDIRGLRSCFDLPLPHEYGSAYRSIVVFGLRRLALPVPKWLDPPALAPTLKADLLRQQLEVINHSRVWTDGGILYAHLPLPHPPGLHNRGSLDTEYAENIEHARALVREWVTRATSRFGTAFSVIVTSDHPLRDYWCASGTYRGDACQLRDAFRDRQVPLIIASPGEVSTRPLSDNSEVFFILNDQARSLPTTAGGAGVTRWMNNASIP